ncbi:hypothetical protein ACNPMJ_15140, partial [Enterococcus faecium]|uniref:hypothetical protein n=1 Tax=Enterococcus faecium TaxID=1352 RepID=UPI003AAF753E
QTSPGRPGARSEVSALPDADVTTLEGIAGVESVTPVRSATVDYVQYDGGDRYVASAGGLIGGQTPQLSAGDAPDNAADTLQVALPTALVGPLGFSDDADAVGKTVTIAVTDPPRTQPLVEA